MPKCYTNESWAPREDLSWFGWIKTTLDYSEAKLLESSGIDSVLYLRCLKYCFILLCVLSLLSCVILMPINSIGESLTKGSAEATTTVFDILSMANIPQGSKLMYAHTVSVFIFSLLTYYTIYKLFTTTTEIEHVNSLFKHDNIQNRTVIISGIPKAYCQSNETLKDYFVNIFGEDKIVHAILVPKVGELEELQLRRRQVIRELQKSIHMYQSSRFSRRPLHHATIIPCPCIPYIPYVYDQMVDSMDHFKNELEVLEGTINEMLSDNRPMRHTTTGFVTFNSVVNAMQCAQSLLHPNRMKFKVQLAPTPADINWNYFQRSKSERYVRLAIMYGLLFGLFLSWSIPVTAISAMSNLDELKKIEALSWIVSLAEKSPVLENMLQGILPSLAMSLFLVLLPYILKIIITLRGHLLNSQYDRTLLRAHWLFLTFNVLFFTVATGVLLNVSVGKEILESPLTLIEMIASSMQLQALKLTNYMVFEGFVGYTLFMFLRVDDFLICKFKQRFVCVTEEEMLEAEQPVPFDYPVQYGRELFIFTVALTYSSTVPMMLPFAACYFALAYITAKYNFVYVLYPRYKGRKLTPLYIDRIAFALFIYQFAMFSMFTLKLFAPGSTVGILVAVTALFKYYIWKMYYKSSKYLALSDCPKPSMNEDRASLVQEINTFFQHPALTPIRTRSYSVSSNDANSDTQSFYEDQMENNNNFVQLEPLDDTRPFL